MITSTITLKIHCLTFATVLMPLLTWGIQLDAAEFSCSSGNVTCLVAAINEANGTPGKDTITLEPGIYTVNSATGNGSAGLPSISSSIRIKASAFDSPTVIARDLAARFFVFDVFVGGELNLEGIAVQALGGPGCFSCRAAISNQGTTTLQNSIVSDSTGAIENTGTLNVLRSIIANNRDHPGVGGIINDGGTVLVENSTIAFNSGGIGGSGGAIKNFGSLVVRNSAIISNRSTGDLINGPAIDNTGSVEIINSTIARNSALENAAISNSGTFSVINSTIRENSSTVGPFPGSWLAGTIQVQNTIVAGNGQVCSGTITSLGNNFFDDPTSGCPTNFQPSDLTGDPGLSALVGTFDDDLPGRVYYRVLAGSPVINKGTPNACPKTDQLGNTRDGVCDIGSVEYQSGVPVAIDVKPDDDDNFINLNGNSTISVAILGTETFDVSAINPSTVKFGPNQTSVRQNATPLRDVNGDGRLDLVVSFRTRETGLSCNDTSMFLSGQTSQGMRIFGFDLVNPSGC